MNTPDVNAFVVELRSLLARTWPEVLPNGSGGGGGNILTAEHVDKLEWDKLRLPYAVIAISATPLWEKRPVNSLIYSVTPQIYYVTAAPGENTGIIDKLSLLQEALWLQQPLATARRTTMGAPVWDDSLRPNQVFVSSKHPARAGMLPVTFLVGSLRT